MSNHRQLQISEFVLVWLLSLIRFPIEVWEECSDRFNCLQLSFNKCLSEGDCACVLRRALQ